MPTFVIHQVGKPPTAELVEGSLVRIGRDPRCDLVLPNVSVSRRHALLARDDDADGYLLEPLSADNPVIVDGCELSERTPIGEGAEIQIGRYYLVFCREKEVPEGYTDRRGFLYLARCEACGQEQQVSALAEDPRCESCRCKHLLKLADRGAAALGRSLGQPGVVAADAELGQVETNALDSRDLMYYHTQTSQGRRAAVVRLAPRGAEEERCALATDVSCTFGRRGRSTLAVGRWVPRTVAEIRWSRTAFVLTRTGPFPATRVNGEKVEKARLEDGDEIRIGRSRFRFLVG